MDAIQKKSKQAGDKFTGDYVQIVGQYTSGKTKGDRLVELKRYSENYHVIVAIRDSRANTSRAASKLIPDEAEELGEALIALAKKARVNAE